MADDTRVRLGRGLAALLGDVDVDPSARQGDRARVPIEFLRPNPRNPRTHFGEAELDELADSIRARGLIQPIVVRPHAHDEDVYEIIAGERRWRAAQRAGLHEVPVVVIEADDRTALELAIIENVQRTDLNALDEASSYERLVADHGYSQADLATALGKSRSHVANMIRLLKLPPSVRDRVTRGELSAGHARALLAFDDPEGLAQRVVDEGLNVRDVERLSQENAGDDARPRRPRRERDADTRALMAELEAALGLAVTVDGQGESGVVTIRYRSLDQLDLISARLRSGAGRA